MRLLRAPPVAADDPGGAGEEGDARDQESEEEALAPPKKKLWNAYGATRALGLEEHQAAEFDEVRDEVRGNILTIWKTQNTDGRSPFEIKSEILKLPKNADKAIARRRALLYNELLRVLDGVMPGTRESYNKAISRLSDDGRTRMRHFLNRSQAEAWDAADTGDIFTLSWFVSEGQVYNELPEKLRPGRKRTVSSRHR